MLLQKNTIFSFKDLLRKKFQQYIVFIVDKLFESNYNICMTNLFVCFSLKR